MASDARREHRQYAASGDDDGRFGEGASRGGDGNGDAEEEGEEAEEEEAARDLSRSLTQDGDAVRRRLRSAIEEAAARTPELVFVAVHMEASSLFEHAM